jgi:hypothetical protein
VLRRRQNKSTTALIAITIGGIIADVVLALASISALVVGSITTVTTVTTVDGSRIE